MFRLLPQTYFWPIIAHVAEDGQVVEKTLFELEFKRYSPKEIEEIGKKDQTDQIKAIVAGWRGCKDVNGEDVPFSETALLDLLSEFPDIAGIVFEAYSHSIRLAKRKN